jgi:hypothetical protein
LLLRGADRAGANAGNGNATDVEYEEVK